MKSVHVKIFGVVQGVFYRVSTQEKAVECNVFGWVKNCKDGSVEALFQGTRENVDLILDWCRVGPEAAVVESVQILDTKDCTNPEEGFNIL